MTPERKNFSRNTQPFCMQVLYIGLKVILKQLKNETEHFILSIDCFGYWRNVV